MLHYRISYIFPLGRKYGLVRLPLSKSLNGYFKMRKCFMNGFERDKPLSFQTVCQLTDCLTDCLTLTDCPTDCLAVSLFCLSIQVCTCLLSVLDVWLKPGVGYLAYLSWLSARTGTPASIVEWMISFDGRTVSIVEWMISFDGRSWDDSFRNCA